MSDTRMKYRNTLIIHLVQLTEMARNYQNKLTILITFPCTECTISILFIEKARLGLQPKYTMQYLGLDPYPSVHCGQSAPASGPPATAVLYVSVAHLQG